ncbi:MAG: NUDIX domain-containing protein [Candidatus Uhrbacteria bacterium]|nr:NUDIX domain-containing protein [Candidatus Uhrbacteria bacterium]
MKIERVYTQAHAAVGAILERDGKILLVHEYCLGHPDHEKWHFPAGWVELGENPFETVVREIKEEAGYDFTPTAILGVYSMVRKDTLGKMKDHPSSYVHGFRIVFLGEIKGEQGKLMEEEISGTKWYTREEIEAMDDTVLRDRDVKQMVGDYFAGKKYPLELLVHTVRES